MSWRDWAGKESINDVPVDVPILYEDDRKKLSIMYVFENNHGQRIGVGGGMFYFDIKMVRWIPLSELVEGEALKDLLAINEERLRLKRL